ncbi:hypothetical protein VTK56DRAFT_9735 [Thermocarpiscus australiensis]
MRLTTQLLLCSLLCSPSSAYSAASNQQQPLADLPIPLVPGPKRPASLDDAPPYRQRLLSLHRDLVEIPSISGAEGNAALFLSRQLVNLNYTVKLQRLPSPPEGSASSPSTAAADRHGPRYNVLAWPGSATTTNPTLSGRVLVTSHIDVVPPYTPYQIHDDGGAGSITSDTLITGRGAVDAKGSVAAQITAVDELLTAGAIRPEDVMLLFVAGEETDGEGMKVFSASLDDHQSFKAAVFGEPTENKLACGHKGIATGTVAARGRAGHSGYPWLGKSATEVLVRALGRLLDADLGSSERYGNTTVNVGLLRGGVAANVIPKEASAKLAVRVAVGNRTTGGEIVRGRLEEMLRETDEEALSLEWVTGYGPVECNCDVEGFETLVVNYGTDVPHLRGDHVSYLYGPGTILVAHGDNEGLRVRDLEAAVEGYKKLIKHAVES